MNVPEVGNNPTVNFVPATRPGAPVEESVPAPQDQVSVAKSSRAPSPAATSAPAAVVEERPATRPVVAEVPKVLVEEWTAPALAAPTRHPGFDPGNLDPTVKPTENFYQYANGGWIAKNPIPEELPRWGSFIALAEKNTRILDGILQEAAAVPDAPRGSMAQKLGDFYASGMDTEGIEKAGLTPLQPMLDRIASIGNLPDLQREVAELHGMGISVLFNLMSTQDFKDTTRVIGEIDQSGLGLPDRDYYLRDDDKSKEIRAAYVDHVAKMLVLAGDEPAVAAANAEKIMAIETRLAVNSRTLVQLRDPAANYNKMDRSGLAELTTNFNFGQYLSDRGLDVSELNVGQPEFFKAMDQQLGEVPIEDWKTYLRWHLLDGNASFLSSKLVDENFHFKGTVLNGTPVIRPRWKRVVGSADSALGELLGQAYVQKNFTPEAKARVKEMVENLKGALREDLQDLPWMGEETRARAIEKMDAFVDKIGYPDKWKDYSTLEIDRGPYVSNVIRASQFAVRQDLDKIGKPVDRTEWGMTPSMVNAYYNPLMNEIVFPAGILQPPFFDPAADDAINYGGIGAVIGHEMTHGFDDQGAQFDARGNLQNWWTEADLANFQQRTGAVSDLFGSYEVEPGLHMNGPLVTGEATADLGGLAIAYRAFKRSLNGKPRPANVDGFTPEQRFFLGFAQVWAGSERPEYARMQVQTDPHPLARFRVNGTLGNTPAFYEAFGVQPGDPMAIPAEKQTRIW